MSMNITGIPNMHDPRDFQDGKLVDTDAYGADRHVIKAERTVLEPGVVIPGLSKVALADAEFARLNPDFTPIEVVPKGPRHLNYAVTIETVQKEEAAMKEALDAAGSPNAQPRV